MEGTMDSEVKPVEKNESWRDIVSVLFIAYLTPVAAIPVWLIARWSNLTKWIVTVISVLSILALSGFSYKGYQFAKFEKSYTPVLEVQQALDLYGLQNGKYPTNLDDLKPKFIASIPTDKDLKYTQLDSGKDYSLKGSVQGKTVELKPALKAAE